MLASGRSEAWLSRLLWEQETMSSNLIVPTIKPTTLEVLLQEFFFT